MNSAVMWFMSRLSFYQNSRDQAASHPIIFTSPHYRSRKLFEHQSNLILWSLSLYGPSTIYTSPLMKNLCLLRETSDVSSKRLLKILSPKPGQISRGCITIESYLLSLSWVHFRVCQGWFTDRLSSDSWNSMIEIETQRQVDLVRLV